MQHFINDNFLLLNQTAKELYFNYAKPMPIIDFHCHLPPAEIAEDKKWENVAQVFLGGDHYKWRAMRSNGVGEKYITGSAPDREKFEKFAETMPKLLRNPIYHWTHLELARFFGIDDLLLSPKTSEEIWQRANAVLQGGLTARACMKNPYEVKVVCTTDDPASDLKYHRQIAKENIGVKVLPTFRPDKAHAVENPQAFAAYMKELGQSAGIEIKKFEDLIAALKNRHDYFHENGCRMSDNGVPTMWHEEATEAELDMILQHAMSGKNVEDKELAQFKSAVLTQCAIMDCDAGWTRQLHIGPMRNNNTKMLNLIGVDTGFDSIGEANFALPLSRHLDNLNSMDALGRTILYNIHPKDNEMLATMIGNFQDSLCPGKIQYGAGWWFLDQIDGMKRQTEALSALGLLSRFVGMLTDSRSFLSYSRHEYYRRILCNMLGDEMEKGLLPNDIELVGQMVSDISYNNAAGYFKF
ncbi:MAG: glucuronate isomerase [Opitutales bacterium]|nr:glucuronate isomerase [Opitutales bacterium]